MSTLPNFAPAPGRLGLGLGLGLGINLDGLSPKHVQSFIETQLKTKSGSYVRSSVLYDRYRTWCRLTMLKLDASDVKLAEVFEQFLTPSRKACGRVWMDVEEAYPITWTEPVNTDQSDIYMGMGKAKELKTIYIQDSKVYQGGIALSWFGFAVCNLVSNIKGSLVIGNTHYDLIKDNETYRTPEDLWIAQIPNVEMSFIFNGSEGPLKLRYTSCQSGPRGVYQVCCTSGKYFIKGHSAKDINWPTMPSQPVESGSVLQVDDVKYTVLPILAGLKGISVVEGPTLKALVAARADYAISTNVPSEKVFHYTEQADDGLYYHCIRAIPPDSDLFLFKGLQNCAIPDTLIKSSHYNLYINNIIKNHNQVVCRTSFGLKELTRNVFESAKPVFDVYCFDTDYRRKISSRFPVRFATSSTEFKEKIKLMVSYIKCSS